CRRAGRRGRRCGRRRRGGRGGRRRRRLLAAPGRRGDEQGDDAHDQDDGETAPDRPVAVGAALGLGVGRRRLRRGVGALALALVGGHGRSRYRSVAAARKSGWRPQGRWYPASVPLVVQKFGGTSVADPERIRAVADHIARTRRRGDDVVAVISAMGKETDELLRLAALVSDTRPGREMDMLITAGERKAMALVSMALSDLGCPAASFTGSQAGVLTDTTHTKARIVDMRVDRIRNALKEGVTPVVGGAQGVSTEHDITFLGRGGSDTTAVALAHALSADACELYTDVPGVFTADPRVVGDARRLAEINFDEMLEMCACGCPKPEMRAVEFARTHGVRLHVRSSFTWEPGTWIHEEDETMEQAIISAVVHDASEVKLTVTRMPDTPGVAAALFRSLADRNVNVDMIVQNSALDGTTDISFTIPKADVSVGLEV